MKMTWVKRNWSIKSDAAKDGLDNRLLSRRHQRCAEWSNGRFRGFWLWLWRTWGFITRFGYLLLCNAGVLGRSLDGEV